MLTHLSGPPRKTHPIPSSPHPSEPDEPARLARSLARLGRWDGWIDRQQREPQRDRLPLSLSTTRVARVGTYLQLPRLLRTATTMMAAFTNHGP